MREAVREVAVVREEEQPLGVRVETADREHARLGRHEVGDDLAPLRIGERRHHTPWLVEQVVDEPRPHGERRAVHLDEIDEDVDAATQDRDFTVDRHPAVGDQLLAVTTAAQASLCEHLLQSVPVRLRRR